MLVAAVGAARTKALEFIGPDELCQVTPTSFRLCKKCLDHNDRKRFEKS